MSWEQCRNLLCTLTADDWTHLAAGHCLHVTQQTIFRHTKTVVPSGAFYLLSKRVKAYSAQCASGLSSHAFNVERVLRIQHDRQKLIALKWCCFIFVLTQLLGVDFFGSFPRHVRIDAVGHSIAGLFPFLMSLHSKTRESRLAG